MANILKRSLKARVFVIFFAVSVVAVSALGAVAYFAGRSTLQKQIEDSYASVGQKIEGAVIQFLDASKVEHALTAGDHYSSELAEKIIKKDADSPRLLKELIAYNKGP